MDNKETGKDEAKSEAHQVYDQLVELKKRWQYVDSHEGQRDPFIDVGELYEKENTALGILKKIRLVGEKGHGIFMLDKELATRTFTPPATGE